MNHEFHKFWQEIISPESTVASHVDPVANGGEFSTFYPAKFDDGSQLNLPIRILPGDGTRAVASFIVNQASFAVEDALAENMAKHAKLLQPDVVIGVPTLGLPLANNVARRLGHSRMVALSTSRKFWYDEELSEPMSSITSPEKVKSVYFDPRMSELVRGKRILLVDDVVSSGTSLAAVLRLLDKADIRPVGISVAMEQGEKWKKVLPEWAVSITRSVIQSPLLQKSENGWKVLK